MFWDGRGWGSRRLQPYGWDASLPSIIQIAKFSSVGWSPLLPENHKKVGATPLGSEKIGGVNANVI
jgi:hypothetical protein